MAESKVSPETDGESAALRTIYVNHNDIECKFVENGITTSKYTWWNFLPKNLFMQFRRASNVYFLVMVILMYIGETKTVFFSAVPALPTLLPLVLVLGLNMLLEIFDDVKRCRKDRKTNAHQFATVVNSGKMERVPWKDVSVGNLVFIKSDEQVPADVVLLGSSSAEGACYVETSNIDGETNLKIRNTLKEIMDLFITQVPNLSNEEVLEDTVTNLKHVRAKIDCELPNKRIHKFNGNFTITHSSMRKIEEETPRPLGPNQLLLRGSTLRNTKWIVGVVVYTGPETKVMLNSRTTPSKLSSIQIMMNKMLVVVAFVMAILVIVSACGATMWVNKKIPWYIKPINATQTQTSPEQGRCGTVLLCGSPLLDWLGFFLTFFTLYNNCVPISLMVTVEACNMVQGVMIANDAKMYFGKEDTPAFTRSSSLSQEIGQIEYIFSDKTGTLTCNKMVFKCAYVDGKIYGTARNPTFDSTQFLQDIAHAPDKKKQALMLFRLVMGVAHTIVAEKDEATGEIDYQAESPDEAALVAVARDMGCTFLRRTQTGVTVEDQDGEQSCYEILAVNQFNSTRKRMSVLCKAPDGRYLVLCKGADNVIIERAVEGECNGLKNTLHFFATQGLRTLVIAYRELTEERFREWHRMYEAASLSVTDRHELLDAAAEEIEKDLVILGATAIEDRLQNGVPQCIYDLREAGIKLWVLTGDKLETAINIGYSSRVLSQDMALIRIETLGTLEGRPQVYRLRRLLWRVSTMLGIGRAYNDVNGSYDHAHDDEMMVALASDFVDNPDAGLGLVVTGDALTVILSDMDAKDRFLTLATSCSVVIACRASPLQKSLLITLVRSGITPEPITLAIGDGANDVAMLQTAHIGVGISGQEGKQAANNSDFALAQFRFLKRLLLVHGRWNYRRIAIVILYSFYKNLVFVFTSFFLVLFTAWSGAPLYEGFVGSVFNVVLFTPIFLTGVFNQDVLDTTSLKHPHLYVYGRLKIDLNPVRMLRVVIFSIIDSLVIFFLPMMCVMDSGSNMAALPTFGLAVFTYVIVVMQLKAFLLTNLWNAFALCNWFLMMVLFFVYLAVLSNWLWLSTISFGAFQNMLTDRYFYACLIGVLAIIGALEISVLYYSRQLCVSTKEVELHSKKRVKKGPSMSAAIVPRSSLEALDGDAAGFGADSSKVPQSPESSKGGDDQVTNFPERDRRSNTTSSGEVVIPTATVNRKVNAPKFRRHSALPQRSGFAFSHPEGGDRALMKHRSLSLIRFNSALHAFGNNVFGIEKEKEEKPSKAGRAYSLSKSARQVSSQPRTRGILGKFYQQRLPSFRFRPKTPLFAGPWLLVCGAVLVTMGSLMTLGLYGKVEYRIQYDGAPYNPMDAEVKQTNWTFGDDVEALKEGFIKYRNMYYSYQKCEAPPYKPYGLPKTTATRCRIAFYIDHPVPHAVLRYRISKMNYGDARHYLSFSPKQLKYRYYKSAEADDLGENQLNSENSADGTCKGAVWTGLRDVTNGTRGITVPCGIRAHTMFNDEYKAHLLTPGVTSGDGGVTSGDGGVTAMANLTSLALNTDDINTYGDDLYTNSKSYDDAVEQGTELPSGNTYLYQMQPDVISKAEGMNNPHFRVWMRIEAFPDFQKLYGKFEDGFKTGDVVVVDVVSRFDVNDFDGRKYIVLAADRVDGVYGWLPVTTIIPPLLFLVPGIISLILGVFVFVFKFTRIVDPKLSDDPHGELSVRAGCFLVGHRGPCRKLDEEYVEAKLADTQEILS